MNRSDHDAVRRNDVTEFLRHHHSRRHGNDSERSTVAVGNDRHHQCDDTASNGKTVTSDDCSGYRMADRAASARGRRATIYVVERYSNVNECAGSSSSSSSEPAVTRGDCMPTSMRYGCRSSRHRLDADGDTGYRTPPETPPTDSTAIQVLRRTQSAVDTDDYFRLATGNECVRDRPRMASPGSCRSILRNRSVISIKLDDRPSSTTGRDVNYFRSKNDFSDASLPTSQCSSSSSSAEPRGRRIISRVSRPPCWQAVVVGRTGNGSSCDGTIDRKSSTARRGAVGSSVRRSQSVGPASGDNGATTRSRQHQPLTTTTWSKPVDRNAPDIEYPVRPDSVGRRVRQQERFVSSVRVVGRTESLDSPDDRTTRHLREQFNFTRTLTTSTPRMDHGDAVDCNDVTTRLKSVCRPRGGSSTRRTLETDKPMPPKTGFLRPERASGLIVVGRDRSSSDVEYHQLTVDECDCETLARRFVSLMKTADRCRRVQSTASAVDDAPTGCDDSSSTTQTVDRLERVLVPTADRYRTPIYYACIVFGGRRPLTAADVDRSVSDEVDECDGAELSAMERLQSLLISSIRRKIERLSNDKLTLETKIGDSQQLESKVRLNVSGRYQQYLADSEAVFRLTLALGRQLARAFNASFNGNVSSSSATSRLPLTHDMLLWRLDELLEVKSRVNQRRLEFDTDYIRYLESVTSQRLDMVWLEDRLDLAHCQLDEILHFTQNKHA